MTIRVGGPGQRGLGALGEQVLLLGRAPSLGRAHIVGQAGQAVVVRGGRGMPRAINPTRPDWVQSGGEGCPGFEQPSVPVQAPTSPTYGNTTQGPTAPLSSGSIGFRGLRNHGLGIDVYRPSRDDVVQQSALPNKPLADGPHYWVGPFLIPASKTGPFTLRVTTDMMRAREDYRAFGSFAVNRIRELSERFLWSTQVKTTEDGKRWATGAPGIPATLFYPAISDLPNRCGLPGGVCVPDNEIWYKEFLSGEKPIFKYKHPTTGKDWVVKVKLVDQGVDSSMPQAHFAFTFEQKGKSWWGKLWDWLKSIIVKVVNTVTDLLKSIIEGILNKACAIAQPVLKQVQAAAAKGSAIDLQITIDDNGVVHQATSAKAGIWLNAKTGMTMSQMNALLAAGTSSGVQSIGTAIISGLCGADAPVTPPVETESSGLGTTIAVAAVGVGVVGAIIYFVTR